MDKIKTDKNILRNFGLIMALCFAGITLILFLRDKHSLILTGVVSLFFLLLTLCAPALLKYFYIPWMKLAFVLSWLNTRLLLCFIFYFIFSPIGLIMRLFRVDLLERKFDRSRGSYWKPKENKQFLPADYERQF
ncbi:MAG: SxtJ family membrane protein [Candidatus Omnitrophota bacterium]